MNPFKNLYESFKEYCDSDEVTDRIIKNDYLYTTAYSGVYLILKENYRFWSILWVILNISISLFEMIGYMRGAKVLIGLNFTLLTFLVQVYLIVQFCVLIVVIMNMKRKAFRIVHKEMIGEIFDYGEDHTDILEGLKKAMMKERKQLLSLPVMLVVGGSSGVIVGPILDSKYGTLGFIANETSLYMDIPIPADYPFPTTHPIMPFFLLIVQGINTLFVISSIGSIALAFINIMQHFTMHQKYLLATINSVESRTNILFKNTYGNMVWKKKSMAYQDKRYLKCYEHCLKKCFCHHQHILRWFDCMNDMFAFPMIVSYGTGTVVIALSLYSLKTGNSLPGTALTCFLTCFVEVAFMALISVFAQRVSDLNEDLLLAIYDTKWYACSEPIKLSLKICQEMTLRPMQLNAMGIMTANLDAFAQVMNSAYSYYNLIMAL